MNILLLRLSLFGRRLKQSLFPPISCEEKNKRYMLSQPHRWLFNMDACLPCDGNWLSHIETGAEKQAVDKFGLYSFAVLWKF
jgi:hypothetical protein